MIRDSIQADRYYRIVTITTYKSEEKEANGVLLLLPHNKTAPIDAPPRQ